MNRWITRCTTCLVITAIDAQPAHNAVCGLCGGHIESMGRVERDRLIEEHLKCKCDDRCVGARGPHCTCKCGGVNHCAGLIGGYELVRTDKGPVPTVTPSAGREQAEINAREYRAHMAAALEQLDVFLNRRARGEFLPRADFDRMRQLQEARRKAFAARVHKTRIAALRKVTGWITSTPISDFAREIDNAPKVAEAPFALRSTPAPTVQPKQTGLF